MKQSRNRLESLLNVSTPYAPANDEEVRERLNANAGRSDQSRNTDHEIPGDADDSSSVPEISAPPTVETAVSAIRISDARGLRPSLPPGNDSQRTNGLRSEGELNDQWLTRFEDKLSTTLERVTSFGSAIAEMTSSHTDPDELVTVTVDGFGNLLALKLSPSSARTGRALGPVITAALAEAREEAKRAKNSVRAMEYRDLPDIAQIYEILHRAPAGSGNSDLRFQAIDEGLRELLDAIRLLGEEHRSRRLEQEIGGNRGSVSAALDGSRVTIDIARSALRRDRLYELEDAIIEAIDLLQEKSAEIVELEFNEVRKRYESRMI